MLEKVIENWTSRLDYIRANLGSPMPEIIFKCTRGLLAMDFIILNHSQVTRTTPALSPPLQLPYQINGSTLEYLIGGPI
ncbi:hypothetical protein TNCV_4171601 [Trichonephila clavipes]|nr:hypothetical protein TNCV_4171601 [Trichonephila clavipes]